ncbi:acetyl-CoA acetyltransferase [Paenibacillus curdlanolyticus YK9]|uniref:acetyl-CoA C-acetyltransferase n=1 Tax=Paenibacillus curdlanolyticus YK9 TaxID=717606 RepID=E0I606_9BACL|nr:acetyl-CoA C-acetyltransferase [Paenibacillus curdlanolyticus]EFM12398.1 acetyl-CoA acetyltransferase [Paenibacillus curdlanolyticus YK9]
MRGTVIVNGARTAFGKLGGVFQHVSAAELGAAAIRGALATSGIEASRIDHAVMGMVLQGGAGQIPSRQAARLAGLAWEVPSETVNKVCASGMRAITIADQIVRSGAAQVLVAGGMESMSSAPFAVPSARWGVRMGHAALTDLMLYDGLLCAFDNVPMAAHGNAAAVRHGISREEQDEWALRSHALAVAAGWQGKFAEEIVPFDSSGSRIDADECPRPSTSMQKLAKLVPILDRSGTGTITAGNAPGVNDGAAAVVVMSAEVAQQEGIKPLAVIIGHTSIGAEPHQLAEAPALAIRKLLQQTGVTLPDIDLIEVNEAFAAVALTCGRMLQWDAERVNVNGGAIALGHPIGASGARIVLTLAHELRRRGGGLGIAAICSGGGQGDAIMIRVDG